LSELLTDSLAETLSVIETEERKEAEVIGIGGHRNQELLRSNNAIHRSEYNKLLQIYTRICSIFRQKIYSVQLLPVSIGISEIYNILLDTCFLQYKKFYETPGFFYQTFLGLGMGKLFPARESLESVIPAGDGNIANIFFHCVGLKSCTP